MVTIDNLYEYQAENSDINSDDFTIESLEKTNLVVPKKRGKFVNTALFSEAANTFLKTGKYIDAPVGHRDYVDFWNRELYKCINGTSIGDIHITGRHYFYLNYCPIDRVDMGKYAGKGTHAKESLFPSFWEIDYAWWWCKEIAMYGMKAADVEFLDIPGLPIKDYEGGKHLCCTKTRQSGFSYKEAADGSYNFLIFPGSKSIYMASHSDYLTKSGILNKVDTTLNHLNDNTQKFFYRSREKHGTLMHQRASYYDSGVERGTFSEIMGIIANTPDKVRGKTALKITLEESGSFPYLLDAVTVLLPSLHEGTITTGQLSVFGTGGDAGAGIAGLEEIFYNPDSYNMLAFNNIWEDGGTMDTVGYFVPAYMANNVIVDNAGNVDTDKGIELELERRKIAALSGRRKLDKTIAEHPLRPSESFMRLQENMFNISCAKQRLRNLVHNKEELSDIMYCSLLEDDAGKISVSLKHGTPITTYPHPSGETNLEGALAIVEMPDFTDKEKEDPNLISTKYKIYVDTYYKDGVLKIQSLWSMYIIKLASEDNPVDKIVAWYAGRPENKNDAHELTLKCSKFYKCKIQAEIDGGGESLKDYLRDTGNIRRAEYEPLTLTRKVRSTGMRNRNYFIKIVDDVKKKALEKLSLWLEEPVELSEKKKILRIQTIKDTALLEEIIKYSNKRNVDRISALCVYMIDRNVHRKDSFEEKDEDSFLFNALSSSISSAGFGYNDAFEKNMHLLF